MGLRGSTVMRQTCKKLLSCSQSNIGNGIPRTLASGRLSPITLCELYVENSLGWDAWHRPISMSTWIESSSHPTLMIGHFPIFRKSRILFELAASLGGSQQLRVDQIIPDNLRNG